MTGTPPMSRRSWARQLAPPFQVSAEYREFGQSSIQQRRASPPGRAMAAWSRFPYLRVTTSNPVVRSTSPSRVKSRSLTTLSRLWRL